MEVFSYLLNPLVNWFSKNPLIVGFLEGIASTLIAQRLFRKQIFQISVVISR